MTAPAAEQAAPGPGPPRGRPRRRAPRHRPAVRRRRARRAAGRAGPREPPGRRRARLDRSSARPAPGSWAPSWPTGASCTSCGPRRRPRTRAGRWAAGRPDVVTRRPHPEAGAFALAAALGVTIALVVLLDDRRGWTTPSRRSSRPCSGSSRSPSPSGARRRPRRRRWRARRSGSRPACCSIDPADGPHRPARRHGRAGRRHRRRRRPGGRHPGVPVRVPTTPAWSSSPSRSRRASSRRCCWPRCRPSSRPPCSSGSRRWGCGSADPRAERPRRAADRPRARLADRRLGACPAPARARAASTSGRSASPSAHAERRKATATVVLSAVPPALLPVVLVVGVAGDGAVGRRARACRPASSSPWSSVPGPRAARWAVGAARRGRRRPRRARR